MTPEKDVLKVPTLLVWTLSFLQMEAAPLRHPGMAAVVHLIVFLSITKNKFRIYLNKDVTCLFWVFESSWFCFKYSHWFVITSPVSASFLIHGRHRVSSRCGQKLTSSCSFLPVTLWALPRTPLDIKHAGSARQFTPIRDSYLKRSTIRAKLQGWPSNFSWLQAFVSILDEGNSIWFCSLCCFFFFFSPNAFFQFKLKWWVGISKRGYLALLAWAIRGLHQPRTSLGSWPPFGGRWHWVASWGRTKAYFYLACIPVRLQFLSVHAFEKSHCRHCSPGSAFFFSLLFGLKWTSGIEFSGCRISL